MDDDGVFDVQGDQPGKPLAIRGMDKTGMPTLLMPKILAETLAHGVFISLPKIKAHRFAVFSLSIKGMQGTVMTSDKAPAFHNKWRTHREIASWMKKQEQGKDDRAEYVASLEALAGRIADVLEVEAPDVVLAEGAPMMGGDGFGEAVAEQREGWPSAGRTPSGWTASARRCWGSGTGTTSRASSAGTARRRCSRPGGRALRRGHRVARGDGRRRGALLSAPRPVHYVAMASFAIHSDASPPLGPAGIAALASPATPAVPAPQPSAADVTSKPVAHAIALGDRSITIDGSGTDAAWASAPVVGWDTDTSGARTGIVTLARFLHAPGALYALWELEGTGLNTDRTRPANLPRPKLYEEDCVEMFFTPDASSPKRYLEMEIGPLGHFFDVSVDRDAHMSDTRWSSRAHIGTTQDAAAHRAVIEAEFTAPEIVAALKDGARLPLALYRMEGKSPGRRYLAWSPPRTAHPDFHVPEAFGTLVVDP